MKLGLQNITEFLETIGSPQQKYDTIHLAGTNGKGSIASMLAGIHQAAGYKVGLFPSPHLVDYRERMTVNGEKSTKRAVISFVDRYRPILVKKKLSFFELAAAMAFFYFAREGVDVAVIETGLGGRLDASNVLFPLLTITTDISKDHVEILGESLEEIAGEKAGIIKPSTPHLIGRLPRRAENVIRRVCRANGAPFFRLGRKDFDTHLGKMQLDFHSSNMVVDRVRPALIGPHQLVNAAVAIKALEVLKNHHGRSVSKKAIRQGMSEIDWPGRFQVIEREGQPTLVLDVCHNIGSVLAFVETFKARFPGRTGRMITGFVKRKPHQRMFDSLSEVAESFSLVPLDTKRSTDMKELAASLDWRDMPVRRFGSLRAAYNRLSKISGPDDIICIIGSHFLVGEFLTMIGR